MIGVEAEKKHEWCAVNRTVIKPQWKSGEPTLGAEKCLAVDASPAAALLTDLDCTKELKYICEVTSIN